MKFKKLVLLVTLVFLISFSLLGANKSRPIRAELSLGIPNLIGVSGEYVIPNFQDGKVSVDMDFSYIPISLDDQTTAKISYIGIGGRYYITEPEKGVYVGGGLSRLNLGMEYEDDDLGTGSADLGTMFLIGKVGYRKFLGPLVTNIEVGYGIGKLDDTIEVTYEDTDGTKTTEEEDTSDVPIGSGQVFKTSIGFAF
ncbi:MAG: hypothetical protein ACQERZ_07635 [Fusobacteriota bacterium]